MIKRICGVKDLFFPLLFMYGGYAYGNTVQNIEQLEDIDRLEERMEQLLSVTRPVTPETGTAKDLFLLLEHKLFYFKFDSFVTYTDNAFSQPEKRSGKYAKGKLALGTDTLIAGRYSVDFNLNYSATRYDRFSELDFDSYGVDSGVSTYAGPLIVGTSYQYNQYMKRGFGDKILSINAISGFAMYAKPITERTGVFVQGSLGYTFGSPDDYDYSTVLISPAFYYRVTDNLTVLGSGWWSKKDYKHYFPATFNISREDDQKGATLKVTYKPQNNDWLSVSGELRYSDNDSTVDDLDFKSFDGSGLIQINVRF